MLQDFPVSKSPRPLSRPVTVTVGIDVERSTGTVMLVDAGRGHAERETPYHDTVAQVLEPKAQ